MTAIAPSKSASFRSVVAGGAVALLCIGLAACSGSSAATSTPRAGAQSPGAATATGEVTSTAPVGATSQTGNGAARPCSLLTQAEAAAAVGQPLSAGVENTPLGMCTYASSDFAAGVDLTVGSWDSMAAAASANGANPTQISGVGDEALNLNGAGGPSLLYVRKGSAGFLITMNGPNIDSLADHGLAKEEALAVLILARL